MVVKFTRDCNLNNKTDIKAAAYVVCFHAGLFAKTRTTHVHCSDMYVLSLNVRLAASQSQMRHMTERLHKSTFTCLITCNPTLRNSREDMRAFHV